jgi:hypothetical protein
MLGLFSYVLHLDIRKVSDTVAILHEDTLHKLCDVIKLYESSKENRT